ncbi:mitochondrial inner membrane peptidase complex catalytic subunit 2 [Basidiobolus meristosporus CBS 931.73]|uniref:Mitochondrial inner membrane protease subunit 2 n=1 Tax=Basidiobolus meristosporus CBS 931.73 TaxID=1314790 RepID=A0A1Y1YT66_9FUNG|nr:mitochondrial inner membrane peptidase complex catalytic subunit 2 [Basidiobolus meristosporus CBS 931.73]|eukprot:ORY00765.1 mitochondrial inner membrane peptidase complex catalytic subunit 2 [Basidiobolus meristosporus CBS 931.73]
MSNIRQVLFKIVQWGPVSIFFLDHICSVATVSGRSMQPTFNPDTNLLKRDKVILNKWSASRRNYSTGDVVALKSPIDPNRTVIKRIIAVEGDLVRTFPPNEDSSLVRIPRGYCWVEGDEPMHSRDSNVYGPVPLGLITAKVSTIVWPPSRFGSVPRKEIAPGRVYRHVFEERTI